MSIEDIKSDNERLSRYIQEAQENVAIALELLKLNDIKGAKDLLIDVYNELDGAVI